MKKIVILSIAFIMCLSLMGCTGTDNTTASKEIPIATAPATEAPTENPVEVAKEKLAAAVEECYTSKYNSSMRESFPFLQTATDRLSITVDTIPADGGFFWYEEEAIECIIAINEYLSFPSSLSSKMDSTRALDGTQSQSCGDFTATWTYHPDHGLEVIYEVNIH